jgi:hypothetical protein
MFYKSSFGMYVKLQSMDTFGPNIQTNVEWL